MSDGSASGQVKVFFEVWQGGRKVAGRIEDPERAQRYALEYSKRYPAEGKAEVRRAQDKRSRRAPPPS